jgi:hypothetical protein
MIGSRNGSIGADRDTGVAHHLAQRDGEPLRFWGNRYSVPEILYGRLAHEDIIIINDICIYGLF